MSTDVELAVDLAESAGALLLDLRAAHAATCTGRELGRRGDAQANAYLLAQLAAERPHDRVLSEESADDPARLGADRVWIIDPLDGTREFGVAGRTDWAVHVALWQAGHEIAAAAVAQPALGTVYASGHTGRFRTSPPRDRLRILVSESRPPDFAEPVARALSADLVTMGSAGAKTMAVLRGDADAYVHAGGQWEWDSAAPVGVALAAGLHASRVDGTPLTYNAAHPYLPDLLICRPDLAQHLLDEISAAEFADPKGSPQ